MTGQHANNETPWPPFFDDLPEVDLDMDGLHGRIVRFGEYNLLLMYADREVVVPRHHHGAQWGIVLDGSMELTIGNIARTYYRGDAHYIPASTDHDAVLHSGWKGLYLFERRTRG